MNVVICDDEKVFADRLSMYIKKILQSKGRKWNISTCYNGEELLEYCKNNVVDGLFLDIDMPGIDGYEVAEKLSDMKENITVVFVTSKSNLIYSSFKYHPYGFVRKTHLHELEYVVSDMITKWNNTAKKECTINLEYNNTLDIDLERTMYLEANNHYFSIYWNNGEKSASYRCSLTDAQKQLEDYGFVRVHNKYLVNCKFIKCIDNRYCVLINGKSFLIGRSKLENSKNVFQNYKRSIR
ncbi:MAG: response regulator transcription factor [Clostridia bacterium]|nr:response regulator transcription factor [Clostridia bacterium]